MLTVNRQTTFEKCKNLPVGDNPINPTDLFLAWYWLVAGEGLYLVKDQAHLIFIAKQDGLED